MANDPYPSCVNGWSRAHLFEVFAYQGDHEAALALLDEAEDDRLPIAEQPNAWGRWTMLLSAVEGLYVLGERDRAAGIAAAAGRCWDDAEEHFRTALRQAGELPHLPEAAHTRRFFATMLLERGGPGDRAEAAILIKEARDLYGRMGMPRHSALLDALDG